MVPKRSELAIIITKCMRITSRFELHSRLFDDDEYCNQSKALLDALTYSVHTCKPHVSIVCTLFVSMSVMHIYFRYHHFIATISLATTKYL